MSMILELDRIASCIERMETWFVACRKDAQTDSAKIIAALDLLSIKLDRQIEQQAQLISLLTDQKKTK